MLQKNQYCKGKSMYATGQTQIKKEQNEDQLLTD